MTPLDEGRPATLASEAQQELCVLCGAEQYVAALFTPDDQRRYGGTPDKPLTFAYALCRDCFGQSGSADKVEEGLLDCLKPRPR